MLRKLVFGGLLSVAVFLTQAPFGSGVRAQVQNDPTAYYVVRVAIIFDRYEPVIRRAGQRNDFVTLGMAYRRMAWELYNLPTFGADDDVVRITRKIAGLADSVGCAALELNNPWLHDHWKAMRVLDIVQRLADIEAEVQSLQRRSSAGRFD